MSAGILEGRTALVTGAAQGIGHAIALGLGDRGARVIANDLRPSAALDELAARSGGAAAVADVGDPEALGAALAAATAEAGPVDVLVCNAALEAMGGFLEQSEDALFSQVDVNLGGSFNCIQAVLPGMRERGFGRIVIISSIWAITGWPRAVGYSASKAGLVSLTRGLAYELHAEGIAVNAIAPGVIDSPQIEVDAEDAGVTLDELRARYAGATALRRVGQPEEIASLVGLLAGPAGGSFSGQVLQPNGGAELGSA